MTSVGVHVALIIWKSSEKVMDGAGASKRARSSPTGLTPVQAAKKPSSKLQSLLTGHTKLTSSRKKLFSSDKDTTNLWTAGEEASLVDYLMRKGHEAWPTSHPPRTKLWEGAARFLVEKGYKAKRTSKSK